MAKRLDIPEEAITKAKELLANKKESGHSLTMIAKLSGATYGIVCGIYYNRFRINETGIKRERLKAEEVAKAKKILRDRDFGLISAKYSEVSEMTGIPYMTLWNIHNGLAYANIGN